MKILTVLLTGQQTPDNRMFDNADVPWQKNLSPSVPTIGHMLRKAGYYAAYKGKWHLNKEFDTHEPAKFFTKEMDEYGFSDYVSPGDLIAHTLGGYEFDNLIAVGDASCDFKDYLGTGVGIPVPPRLVKTSYLWTVSAIYHLLGAPALKVPGIDRALDLVILIQERRPCVVGESRE